MRNLVSGLLAVLLCVGTGLQAQTNDTASAEQRPEAKVAIPVTAKPLADVVVYPEFKVSAKVLALRDADISVEAAGVVKALSVTVGSRVNKGDVLLSLACRDARLQRELAQSGLALASKEWRRAEKLQLSKAIPEQQYNQSRAAFEQAGVQLKQAELQVSRCQLSAPFAGVVTARYAQLGAYLPPAAPAIRLLDPQQVEGSANVTPVQLQAIKQAPVLSFTTAGHSFAVRFRVEQAYIDPFSSQQEIRFTFDSADALPTKPLPGSSGELSWRSREPHLPANLMLSRERQLGYFAARDGYAVFVALPDARLGHPASLATDQLDEWVVTDGRHRLENGAKLKIAE